MSPKLWRSHLGRIGGMEVWGWSRRGQRFNTACSRAGKQWRRPNTEKKLIAIKVCYGAIGS